MTVRVLAVDTRDTDPEVDENYTRVVFAHPVGAHTTALAKAYHPALRVDLGDGLFREQTFCEVYLNGQSEVLFGTTSATSIEVDGVTVWSA